MSGNKQEQLENPKNKPSSYICTSYIENLNVTEHMKTQIVFSPNVLSCSPQYSAPNGVEIAQ
jgi:hypothetical protein